MSHKKLTATTTQFSAEMLRRLQGKHQQGFRGWDRPGWHTLDIPRRMQGKVTEVLLAGNESDPQDLIDIANFAMMLHYKITPRPPAPEGSN